MSGQSKQFYHCERCGEVFRSSIKDISELTCTECGAPPVRDGFARLAQMPLSDQSLLSSHHGVAGKDEADFFSLQRRNKKRKAIAIYSFWLVILMTTMIVGFYVKKSQDEKAAERDAINKENIDYEKRRATALRACLIKFQNFSTSYGENQKSQHVYNGTDYLVNIRKYYTNPLNKEDYKNKKIRIIRAKLIKKEGIPSRVDLLIKIDYNESYNQVFEAIFWQQDEDWYLDWPQFVRNSELNWTDYLKNKSITGDYQFRVYVRKRKTDLSTNNGYTELVMSEAINNKNKPSDESTPVLVKKNTELEKQILKHIELIETRKLSDKDVIGVLDSPGQARVNVRLAYEEIGGEKVIVLKELISKNWFCEVDATEEVKK